jgi:hypothetical protein
MLFQSSDTFDKKFFIRKKHSRLYTFFLKVKNGFFVKFVFRDNIIVAKFIIISVPWDCIDIIDLN